MLLEHLVIHQHVVGRLALSLPHRRRRSCLALPPEVRRRAGSLVEVVDVMSMIEALEGPVLLRLVPGACVL